MATHPSRFTLATLAEILGGTVDGPPDLPLERPAPAGENDPVGVTFAENENYLALAEKSSVGAVIVAADTRVSSKPLIRVGVPRLAFGKLLAMSRKEMEIPAGIHPTAIVEGAEIDPTAAIGAYVVVRPGARIGPRCRIHPFCFIGEECTLGEGVTLYPRVVLYRDIEIGDRSTIHSGSVIGADGFGYIWTGTEQMKVPQVGKVRLGSNVEVGALTAIDRATAGATVVGDGTKIDNLVQIGHNCTIGKDSVIAGHCGIGGSSHIGDRVTIGGAVSVGDHVNITNDVFIGGRSGVPSDLKEPGEYAGFPATSGKHAKRSIILTTKLPEMLDRIRDLERRLKELESSR